MSADPNASPPPEPPVTPNAETPIEALPQKRRHRKGESGAASSGAESADDEIIVLSSLLQNLIARKQGGEPATEAEGRGKMNRFVARNTPGTAPAQQAAPVLSPAVPASSAPQAQPTDASPPALPAAASTRSAAGPEGMAAIAFPKFEPRAYQPDQANAQWQRNGSTWGRGILYFAFTAGLTLAGFLAGSNDAHKKDAAQPLPAAPPSKPWTPTATERLNAALTADRNGDLAAARQAAMDLQKDFPDDPSLIAYLSTIDTRLGKVNDVEATLSRLVGASNSPERNAIFAGAQAFNYTRRREFERAVECFGEVAKGRPFDALNLLRLAETQRRLGRFADASDTFQEALLRLPPVPALFAEREYAAFKQRLALLELGKQADLKVEIDQHLAAPVPTGYWLLTGAAAALQKGEVPSAVDLLKRAQAALPPGEFTGLMNDYFFRSFAYHPEVVPFLTTAPPGALEARRLQMEYFIDP